MYPRFLNLDFKDNHPLGLSLETALNCSLASTDTCIFISCGYSVGVVRQNDNFYIFDSHATDIQGNTSSNWKCSILMLTSSDEACSFFRQSFLRGKCEKVQFEITSLKLKVIQSKSVTDMTRKIK